MSRAIGNEAETLAVQALKDNGYEILERNYSCRVGEIDIIATKDSFICFIEVKYRNPMGFGTAVDAITSSKMRKILMTAKNYLYQTKKTDTDYRIDAVLIDGSSVEIIENIYTEGMKSV